MDQYLFSDVVKPRLLQIHKVNNDDFMELKIFCRYNTVSPNKLFWGSKTGKMQHFRRWKFFCLQCRSSINPSFLQIWMQNLAPFMGKGDFSLKNGSEFSISKSLISNTGPRPSLCFLCSFNCFELFQKSKLPYRSLFWSQTDCSFSIEKKES